MRKDQELNDPGSCLNRAHPNEMMFVLLARDAAAPDTIRFWIHRRTELKLNAAADPKLHEARICADTMEKENSSVKNRHLVQEVTRKLEGALLEPFESELLAQLIKSKTREI